MADLFARLKQRKLVQWAVAYAAFAFALIQVLDVVTDSYGWPHTVMHIVFGLLVLGFVIALVLAWYHGERGAQRISGPELLLIALVLAVGGGLLWHFARTPSTNTAAESIASVRSPDAAAPAAEYRLRTAPATIQTAPAPAKSIAVLPFENLSTDKGNAYFADGMQDLILTKLADIGDLKVISRTSTMQYGSHPQNLKAIAQQLGVATILEGSVQKAGNQVLINVQLIDARTDNHLWAQSYQRTLDNIFGVEGEVAQKVADALKAKLSPRESTVLAQTPTTNPQAYDAYLHGLAYDATASMSDENWLNAAHAYAEAVRLDPGFALAWARLSIARSRLYQRFFDHGPAALAVIKQAADKAFALQPDLGEVWLAKAYYYDLLNDDKAELQALQQAQQRLPNSADVLGFMGGLDVQQGHWQQAIERVQHATRLDPRNTRLLFDLGQWHADLRQFALARAAYDQALLVTPGDPNLLAAKAATYQNEGDLDQAEALLQGVPVNPKNFSVFLIQIHQDFYQRRFAQAISALQSAIAHADSSTSPYDLAAFYGLLTMAQRYAGDRDAARATGTKWLAQMKRLPKSPADDPGLAIYFAGAYAATDDKAATFREAKRARTLNVGKAFLMVNDDELTAQFHAQFGDTDAAIAAVPHLLQVPEGLTVENLRLDPAWDPIRHDPRFQALLKKYAKAVPANASTVATAAAVPSTAN
jgi:TolB-like protein/predicted Zn-dependent protease